MNRVLLLSFALVGAVGCGADPAPRPAAPPADPTIRVEDSVGGGVGPVNGGRGRKYEGPASLAPDWARNKPPATNK